MIRMIRVAVAGAAGRMGREVVRAVAESDDCELVAAIDRAELGRDAGELAGIAPLGVALGSSLADAIQTAHPEVLVDFTVAASALENSEAAIAAGISPVIGTTGLSAADVDRLRNAASSRGVGALIAPNFA